MLDAYPGGHGIHRGRHREYTLRTTDAGEGKRYRVAILRQIEQGNGEAQEAARDLIDDLQPSLLLVVGIAGGLPSDDIRLGDVVTGPLPCVCLTVFFTTPAPAAGTSSHCVVT